MLEDLVLAAKRHDLSFDELERMTVGMLIDLIVAYDNKNVSKDDVVYATQADIDAF